MAREITGDITAITDGYIMHQVNCQNVMGAGVAKSLATNTQKSKKPFMPSLKPIPNLKNALGGSNPFV